MTASDSRKRDLTIYMADSLKCYMMHQLSYFLITTGLTQLDPDLSRAKAFSEIEKSEADKESFNQNDININSHGR